MKRLLFIFVTCICVTMVLSGCAKVLSEETETVQAVIVDCNYTDMWVQYYWIDGMQHTIIHPSKYEVILEYDSKRYRFDNSGMYDKCKTNIGGVVNAIYKTVTYDNGKAKSEITGIE